MVVAGAKLRATSMGAKSRLAQVAMLALAVATSGCQSRSQEQDVQQPAVSIEAAQSGAPASTGAPQQNASKSSSETAANAFEARLEIDEKPGGKRFQGVWLKRADGSRLLIDYRANRFWRSFEGRRVTVEGERYSPQGQAIGADHFRVSHLRLADLNFQQPSEADMDAAIIELWGEQSYTGKFTTETIGPGRKLSGSSFKWFIADGGERFLVYDQNQQLPLGKPVKIRARRVKPTPFIARLGGPYLWIVDIDERPQ